MEIVIVKCPESQIETMPACEDEYGNSIDKLTMPEATVKKYNIPIEVLRNVFKFMSYFNLDDFMNYCILSDSEKQILKREVYDARLRCRATDWVTEYSIENLLHREDDLPAREYHGGRKEWWCQGYRHRLKKAAIECADGHLEWFERGQRHRRFGPAFISAKGRLEWYIKGKMHNADGPAEIDDGYIAYHLNGFLHNNNGPAVIEKNGELKWYIKGFLYKTRPATIVGKYNH
jgi:hypothetical protein